MTWWRSRAFSSRWTVLQLHLASTLAFSLADDPLGQLSPFTVNSTTTDKFTSLTKEHLSRWLDQIFHPAVYRYCEADYTQHLPASHRHALANSKAHQVEGRQVETASYQAQQSIGYHLQPEYLEQIWADILATIRGTPGLADFRDPQLFFSAKGIKLQFKTSPSRPTFLDAMENFQSYFELIIDSEFVHLDRFYADIGK